MKRRLAAVLLSASVFVVTGIACTSQPAVLQTPPAVQLTPVESATALPRQPIVPSPLLTFTPTPTRTVVAVEATATIEAVELWHGTVQSAGNLPEEARVHRPDALTIPDAELTHGTSHDAPRTRQ